MKQWMDEKGKLFGVINPVDLIVILAVLALGIKVISDYRPLPLQTAKYAVRVGVIIPNAPPYLAKSLAVNQDVFHERTHAYLGKIVSITSKPAEVLVTGDGKIVRAVSPRNLDIRMELARKAEILTSSRKYGIYLGKLVVRVGESLDGYTLYTQIRGKIEYLRKDR